VGDGTQERTPRADPRVRREFGAEYLEGENPWGLALRHRASLRDPERARSKDAKTLVKNGCKLVAEGANMPTTPEAIKVFHEGEVLFGPAKAANAGGVAVSGSRDEPELAAHLVVAQEVDEKLQNIMRDIHDKCVEYGAEGQVGELREGREHRGLQEGRRRDDRPGRCLMNRPGLRGAPRH
jgi:glutamate dehydrogenase (NADP+)